MHRSEVEREPGFPADQRIPQAAPVLSGGALPVAMAAGDSVWRLAGGRDARVLCILAGVILMSLADLSMTLLHVTSVGMAEENPIARMLMRYGGVASLCGWKAGTVAIGVFILWRTRRHVTAEIGAWICFLILGALCLHWASYNAQVSSYTAEILAMKQNQHATDWVVMQGERVP